MRKISDLNDMLLTIIGEGERHGLMHALLDDTPLDGRVVQMGGHAMINFASCCYMGLETDARLKAGAVEATMRYGTQLSASRLFMSASPYGELEEILSELGGSPALVTPTTTLGHISTLPVLIHENDAVIYDQRVHNSVQTAARLLPGHGVHLEQVKHNRMDLLEERIRTLRQKHRHVWYLADGIYSIYGNRAPVGDLEALLGRYEQLHIYFDDAHGTSWLGRHGRGFALSHLAGHPRVVTALSLNKAFAASGGCLFFPDVATREKVRTCGGPMNFSGPIQPPMLGAALASARLHVSDEFPDLQAELSALIQFTDSLLASSALPVASSGDSPIYYIGMGLPRAAHLMGARLMADGYFVTAATFPGVPVTKSGMRVTLTRHLGEDDVRGLVRAMERHLPAVLEEAGSSLEEVCVAFDLPVPAKHLELAETSSAPALLADARLTIETRVPANDLRLDHHRRVQDLDAAEWDGLLGDEGTFTVAGLGLLETLFHDQPRPEDNWGFHYFVVRDAAGKPVLATFFTEALWKDDMLSRVEVSREIEAVRRRDPYYLTSRTLAMGSLLTEGAHLYLDRAGPWREALALLLKAVGAERERCGASSLVLRDFAGDDPELEAFLLDKGLFKFQMPESCVVPFRAADDEAHLARLSYKSRHLLRKEVLRRDGAYELEIIASGGRALTPEEVAHVHGLYRNVKDRNVGLNTFELPAGLFGEVAGRAPWELLLLRLKPEHGGPADGRPVAASANFVGRTAYVPLVLGLDYTYVRSHALYRTMLWQAVRRARHHGSDRILFGFGAPMEKHRVGATTVPQFAYIMTANHDNMDLLMQHMENTRA